jgi:hypothetical protein
MELHAEVHVVRLRLPRAPTVNALLLHHVVLVLLVLEPTRASMDIAHQIVLRDFPNVEIFVADSLRFATVQISAKSDPCAILAMTTTVALDKNVLIAELSEFARMQRTLPARHRVSLSTNSPELSNHKVGHKMLLVHRLMMEYV